MYALILPLPKIQPANKINLEADSHLRSGVRCSKPADQNATWSERSPWDTVLGNCVGYVRCLTAECGRDYVQCVGAMGGRELHAVRGRRMWVDWAQYGRRPGRISNIGNSDLSFSGRKQFSLGSIFTLIYMWKHTSKSVMLIMLMTNLFELSERPRTLGERLPPERCWIPVAILCGVPLAPAPETHQVTPE